MICFFRKKITPFGFLLFLFSLFHYWPANAEEPVVRCDPGGTQAEMSVCAADDFHKSDDEMNKLYKEAISHLDSDAQQSLRDAQRAWIVFRDKECAYEAGPKENTGSLWPLERNECLKDLTVQRIQNLKKCSGDHCN